MKFKTMCVQTLLPLFTFVPCIIIQMCVYIYEIKCLLWFHTKFNEYIIVYMIVLPTDGMEVHRQCTRHHSLQNIHG